MSDATAAGATSRGAAAVRQQDDPGRTRVASSRRSRRLVRGRRLRPERRDRRWRAGPRERGSADPSGTPPSPAVSGGGPYIARRHAPGRTRPPAPGRSLHAQMQRRDGRKGRREQGPGPCRRGGGREPRARRGPRPGPGSRRARPSSRRHPGRALRAGRPVDAASSRRSSPREHGRQAASLGARPDGGARCRGFRHRRRREGTVRGGAPFPVAEVFASGQDSGAGRRGGGSTAGPRKSGQRLSGACGRELRCTSPGGHGVENVGVRCEFRCQAVRLRAWARVAARGPGRRARLAPAAGSGGCEQGAERVLGRARARSRGAAEGRVARGPAPRGAGRRHAESGAAPRSDSAGAPGLRSTETGAAATRAARAARVQRRGRTRPIESAAGARAQPGPATSTA